MSDERELRPWAVDPDTVILLRLKKAQSALDRGDADLALVEAEELLEEAPAHADALLVVGRAALALHDAGMARAAFEQVIDQRAADVDALEGLAVARFESVDFPGSLESARAAVAADPKRGRAWYYQGLALERVGPSDEAVRCFERAHTLEPAEHPLPRNFSETAWEDALAQGRKALPGPIRAFFSKVAFRWERFPDQAELTERHPPLSPFSYALYEGTPPERGDPWTELPRCVRLFRGNLRHGTRTTDELAERIAEALMHEAAAWLGVLDPDAATD